ncbi:MAG: NUDIX domain-containing protein [Parafilimonas sp.]
MKKKIIAAGGIVTNEKGELLMIFRRSKWDLPKGKLDEGESVKDCAIREVKEETGLKQLIVENLAGITYHEYFDKYFQTDVLKETYWFAMKAKGEQKLIPQTDEDIKEIKWVSEKDIDELLQNSYPNIIAIIHEFQKKNL